MREFFINLAKVDRRYVYIAVAVFTIVPLFIPLHLPPPSITPYTQTVFDEVNKCGPNAKPILLSIDYDPSTLAELQPMAIAILRQIFARKGKVMVMTFTPAGAGLAQQALYDTAREFPGIKEGVNFAYLGFNTPPSAVMLGIGKDIRTQFPTDARGVFLDKMPIFKGVRNYQDILIVIDLAGTSMPQSWIMYANERYHANFTMGVTAVSAANYTPFVGKQSQGMLEGMVGAAEYERLIVEHHYWPKTGYAYRGMDSQGSTHVLILLLILVGNIGYFLSRRRGGAR